MRMKVIVSGAALAAILGAALFLFLREDETVARGRVLYNANCASCHGANLEGQPDWQIVGKDGILPAPPHDDSGHTWHHSDTVLIDYITLGGEGAMAKTGVPFNSGMPAFGEVLSDQEIASILAFIKSTWSERERSYQADQTAAENG